MPFSKLLQSLKKNRKEMWNKSKSTTDLLEGRKNLATSPNFIPTPNNGLKKKSLSKPALLLSSLRGDNGISAKDSKKDIKHKVSLDVTNSKKFELSTIEQGKETEKTQVTDQVNGNLSNENTITMGHSRSRSYCPDLEPSNRERRMSDIAQLDHYISYHQKRATEDGNNANRLVCAQILKESLLKFELMRQNGLLRSQAELNRSTPNLNHNTTTTTASAVTNNNNNNNNGNNNINNNSSSNHLFQKNKAAPNRRFSQWNFTTHHSEPRLNVSNIEKRRSWAFDSSEASADYGLSQFDLGNDYTKHDTDCEPADTADLREVFKKSKLKTKRRSVPVITAQEIEIF